ncbi:MAG: VTT domain-containing protein [Alicyclobacillus sp.]|nr:VTT domain-containing protein [Alicyclobacillus sp.]
MLTHVHHWYALVAQGGTLAAWVGFWLIVFVSFVPVLPIPLIAGAMGAVLPLVPAVLAAWLGACFGALLKFFLERTILLRPVNRWLRRYRHWRALVALLERHGFYAVLMTRLIPVFPSSVVNTAGAVTGIPISAFVWATLLGKLPTMVVFTVAGAQLTTHFWRTMAWLSLYGMATGGAAWWVGARLRRRPGAPEGRSQPGR